MAVKKRKTKLTSKDIWVKVGLVLALALIAFLMLFRLGSIMPGISPSEYSFYSLKLGWHGIYHVPLNLPLNVLYSAVFKFLAPVGPAILRLPAAITGGLTIVAFGILMQLWYGPRTALIGTLLFATSAWTLHVSRLADYNVQYLAAMTFFLLSTAILQKRHKPKYIYWLINLLWGLLLYVPGMIILIIYNIYRQRGEVGYGLSRQTSFWSKLVYAFCSLIWLPLLIRYIIRAPKNILYILGLPLHYARTLHILKEFAGVFYHIFVRGPLLPNLWLGRAPILDIFSVITALTGIYFYARHIKATRTHLLFISFIISAVLIALGGSVPLSMIMPIIYIFIAAGVAYLLSLWLSTFPENPVARSVGYILISLAVAASVMYNVRSYYVAWPHNTTSTHVFDVRVKD